jgi:CcmD family protein
VNLSQGELVALAYAAVFVFVLFYVAIIAAKLARLERETADLLELAARRERPEQRAVAVEIPGDA